jgi:hypothetical protein
VPIADGFELHVRGDHPIAEHTELRERLAEAIRIAAGRILSPHPAPGSQSHEPKGSTRVAGYPKNENRSET